MNQKVAFYIGLLVGAVYWLALRTVMPTPGAFLSIVLSGLVAMGLYGLVRGEISIAGRGGRLPKYFVGTSARLIGLLVLAVAGTLGYVYVLLHGSQR